ncbi:hypothetical protein GCM10010388_36960 [Streptomyces mauvecolor]
MTSGAARIPTVEDKRRVVHSSPEVRHPPLPTTSMNEQERTMADTAARTIIRTQGRRAYSAAFGARRSGPRHPLVATAMVLPLAALLAVVFGGWDAVVTQASSVGVMLGR